MIQQGCHGFIHISIILTNKNVTFHIRNKVLKKVSVILYLCTIAPQSTRISSKKSSLILFHHRCWDLCAGSPFSFLIFLGGSIVLQGVMDSGPRRCSGAVYLSWPFHSWLGAGWGQAVDWETAPNSWYQDMKNGLTDIRLLKKIQ